MLGALLVVLEPVLGARATWPAALTLLVADSAAAWRAGTGAGDTVFLLVNNAVLVLAVIGVANLWAQSGLRARDTALLAGSLAVYDAVATAYLPLTDTLLGHLAGLPFVPLVAWTIGAWTIGAWTIGPAGAAGGGLGIGLGDLLLATVGPLVLRKAYGRRAGLLAAALALAALAVLLALLDLGLVRPAIPAMVVLGPLLVAQYLGWERRGPERTTWEYLQSEPVDRDRVPVQPSGRAAVR
jgi:hypothetical protein